MAAYSIVVVTWRSRADLERLVASMNRHLDSTPELVVVENASGEDPEPAAAAWRGPVRLLREPRNSGFGAACNDGVAAAAEPAVALLNPDTELLDASLDRLVAFAAARDVLAGPRLLNADRSRQPSASGPPVGLWPWLRALAPGAIQPPALAARTEPWRLERAVAVAWLTGACVAARRETLLALGPFDPSLDLYAEDMDLGLRAAAAGVGSWFRPDLAALVHFGGASSAQRFEAGAAGRIAARNRIAVLRRAFGSRAEVRASRAERLGLALRSSTKRLLGIGSAAGDAAALAAAREASEAARPPARRRRGRGRARG